MPDPYRTRFDIEDIYRLDRHIRIIPQCGKELIALINGKKSPDDGPYAPWHLNAYGWLIMANTLPRPWPDAAARLKGDEGNFCAPGLRQSK